MVRGWVASSVQYVALAPSRLHFTDTFDAGFKKNYFPLTIGSLEASKPLNPFIESHQHYAYWCLIYMGFFGQHAHTHTRTQTL